METDNNTDICSSPATQISCSIEQNLWLDHLVTMVIAVAAILLNLVVIATIIIGKDNFRVVNSYILSIAAADLLATLTWFVGSFYNTMCSWYLQIILVASWDFCTQFSSVAYATDQYTALAKPTKYIFNNSKKYRNVIGGIWASSLLLIGCHLIGHVIRYLTNGVLCSESIAGWSVLVSVLLITIINLSVCFLELIEMRIVCKKERNISSTILPCRNTNQGKDVNIRSRQYRVISTMVVLSLLNILMITPAWVIFVLGILFPSIFHQPFVMFVAHWVLQLIFIIRPIFYSIRLHHISECFKGAWQKLRMCCPNNTAKQPLSWQRENVGMEMKKFRVSLVSLVNPPPGPPGERT